MRKKQARILVVGLDNSGKTTLIHHIKPKKVESLLSVVVSLVTNDICAQALTLEVTPTVGFQVEEFAKNNINFTIYDMSGQGRYRSLWEHYYTDAQAIVFVIDSTDRIRLCVVKEELAQLLNHPSIKDSNAPVLLFANKVSSSYFHIMLLKVS